LRFAQKLDHFLQFFLGLFHAGNIGERDGRLVTAEHARARLSEGHGGVVAALRLSENEEEGATQNQERQNITQSGKYAQPGARRPDFDHDFIRAELVVGYAQIE